MSRGSLTNYWDCYRGPFSYLHIVIFNSFFHWKWLVVTTVRSQTKYTQNSTLVSCYITPPTNKNEKITSLTPSLSQCVDPSSVCPRSCGGRLPVRKILWKVQRTPGEVGTFQEKPISLRWLSLEDYAIKGFRRHCLKMCESKNFITFK